MEHSAPPKNDMICEVSSNMGYNAGKADVNESMAKSPAFTFVRDNSAREYREVVKRAILAVKGT